MRLDLQPHPAAPPSSVRRIMVNVGRDSDNLRIRFRIPDDPARLDLPAVREPQRADGLWERTCFECFIREAGSAQYHEYNLSPSTQWAHYRFDGYRSGRIDPDMPEPVVKISTRPDRFELSTRIWIPELGKADWKVGLSAIVEEKRGPKTYWALAHPPGDPDFHHPDCFQLEFPSAEPT